MAVRNVPPRRGVAQIAALLDSPEITRLMRSPRDPLDGTPWLPIRAMIGLALVKSVYAIPTWFRTVRLVIDGSDLPASANGFRDLPNGKPRDHYADPDASWGHRSAISTRKGGGFYGYKLHAAVCAKTLTRRVSLAVSPDSRSIEHMFDTFLGEDHMDEVPWLDCPPDVLVLDPQEAAERHHPPPGDDPPPF